MQNNPFYCKIQPTKDLAPMKFIKITAGFQAPSLELAEEMICHIFFSFKLKGVVCDIPIPEPDEGFGTQTLDPPEQNAIIGYLPAMDSSELALEKITQKLAGLESAGVQVRVSREIVDEKDWADAWKDYFNVTRITDRIVVKPEWKAHDPAPDELVIHIDPGMAFGTGTHPTTAMCLELIETHLRPGQTLLDVGCGSGILMIAGAKLGAGSITGIDTDPMAVEISGQNMLKNRIPKDRFHLKTATLDQLPQSPHDLIVANIIAQVLADIAEDLEKRMHADSIAILSGIIRERKPDVLAALTAAGLETSEEKTQGEWVALTVRQCRP